MQVLTFVLKTDFYRNNSTVIEGQIIYNIFITTDHAVNARTKKPIVALRPMQYPICRASS
jgi:hypothetical protein